MLQASVAFSVMAMLTHALRDWCGWQVIALVRCGCALVFTAVIARAAGIPVVAWKPLTLWVRSFAGSVSMVCTFYSLTRLPVSDVLTLINIFPLWVALLSWPLLGEAPPSHVWLALVSGVAGVALIQRPHLARGDFAIVVPAAGSFFTAVAMIGLHRLRELEARTVVVHFSAVALCFCVASLFVFENEPTPREETGRVVLMLLGVGVTATVGQILLTRAFAAGDPSRVSVIGLTQIVFVLVLEVALSQKELEATGLAGMALVLGPTAWLMAGRGAEQGPGPDG
jgi:drug/metabolite transporter (DMT)-like permease